VTRRRGPSRLLAAAGIVLGAACGRSTPELVLATTTSTQDTGLLDSLLPPFSARTGINVKVIAVGTGAALEMARRGDADVVLVHSPEAEQERAARSEIVGGRRIMRNEFLLLGPPDDPAGAARAGGLLEALRMIARTGPFVSRGDGSGTEIRELALWREAGVVLDSVVRREETGQGMGATLLLADQRRAYTLSDIATYFAFRGRLTLVPVVEGDARLDNIYHAWVVNPERHASVDRAAAESFVAYLVSPDAQALIGRFGAARFGRPLYVPDTADAGPRDRPR
jgi:tungstate transport system substrate-binding protein